MQFNLVIPDNTQSQKFSAITGEDEEEDDDLEEESLLETPLDDLEPYGLFKEGLMSKPLLAGLVPVITLRPPVIELQQEQPQFYENLMKQLEPQEQQVLQAAVQQADIVAAQAALANQVPQTNGHGQ